MFDITKIVKGNTAEFNFYRNGKLYYWVIDQEGIPRWEFPIDITDIADIGNATFTKNFKAITLMRYIRKSIDNDSIVALT